MSNKIKILVIPNDRKGVGMYRSVNPHLYLDKLYGDEFDVDIIYDVDFSNLKFFDQYNIVHISKRLIKNDGIIHRALKYMKEHNIVSIYDIDDWWNVGVDHPSYNMYKTNNSSENIIETIKLADYVTTTTDLFAEKIKVHNKNVIVLPNAIDPEEEQYKPIKNESDRIRFGFVMGAQHERDMEQFQGVINSLPQNIIDKIQIVLCGFNTDGQNIIVNKNGDVVDVVDLKPTENVWYRYESILTDNYKICSDDYKKFLYKFSPNTQYENVDNEPYRREWTKKVNEYATHYRNIDCLLAPLKCNDFNYVKSELKFIEGGFTHTAVIATDFGPYTIGSKSLFKKGGEINPEGNCILIQPEKAHKAWAQSIRKIVEHPEYIKIMTNNMYNTVKDKYDIRNITKKRAELYKKIVKK